MKTLVYVIIVCITIKIGINMVNRVNTSISDRNTKINTELNKVGVSYETKYSK